MAAQEKRTMSWCKKLLELPTVVTEWQQTAWWPECDYYSCGICVNPLRRDGNVACPFDGKELPLREMTVEAPNDEPRKLLAVGFCAVPEGQPRSQALEQAIKGQIVNRTGGRIQALEIERMGGEVVVRGSASCYYLKQLALQGVLDVLQADRETKVDLNFQVSVRSPGPMEPAAPVRVPFSSPKTV